ncbi:hypothetical protein EXIGLDRAFT_760429 [Exidia glandulosa HHB12029]|uniref:F-box domain-containing protein n=1 Tax=Exidia glandulosa HHB12029 TaxID=1314781 RepID=A0A165P977_EXIGL|nr:hypothetical protein EXIGLDRAFT_760429 [Exidia glandulosa HHB12029]
MFDCVAISQVCHHWRELAIGSPRLWLAPHFFSCTHSSGCACTSCTALDVAGINPRNHKGPTNFELVTHILERRTANLPLRVHLTVVAAWTDRNAVAHLSYTLTNYAHRLVELSFVTEDTSIPREFMIHCVELPALRSFVCRNLDSGSHDSEGLFDEPISLPALEYLELEGPIYNRGFPPWEARLSFPFVQTSRVFVWDPMQLNADVAAWPAVERLVLTVHPNFQFPRDLLDADQARVRSIKDVHISLDVPDVDAIM